MKTIMKRYFDEGKITLIEYDYYENGMYLGTTGIYQSPDGKYFFAKYNSNGCGGYTGEDYLEIISENLAKEAASKGICEMQKDVNENNDFQYYLITYGPDTIRKHI